FIRILDVLLIYSFIFFFNDPATPEIYTLSVVGSVRYVSPSCEWSFPLSGATRAANFNGLRKNAKIMGFSAWNPPF
ncbi:hypothetical protein, partial [Salmonella enterica]